MKLEKELTYNQREFENDDFGKSIDETIMMSNDNLKLLKELAKKSLEKRYMLLGGIFRLTVADGVVFYQIVEVTTNGWAFAKRCAGICLDMYEDDILGQGEWISEDKATKLVNGFRAMEKLFGGNG